MTVVTAFDPAAQAPDLTPAQQARIAPPALRNSTPEIDARWLAAFEESCAQRGLEP